MGKKSDVLDLVTGRPITERIKKGFNICYADNVSITQPDTISADGELYGTSIFVDEKRLSREHPELKTLLEERSKETDAVFFPEEVLSAEEVTIRRFSNRNQNSTSLLHCDLGDKNKVPVHAMPAIVNQLKQFYLQLEARRQRTFS